MNKSPLYSLHSLDEMLGGDKQAKLQMMQIFLQTTPKYLHDLFQRFEDNDLDGVSRMAHKIKSSIDIFCIDSIRTDIRTLENFSRDKIYIDEIPPLVNKIDVILKKVLEQLSTEKETLEKEQV